VAARGARAWDARVTTSGPEKLRFIVQAAAGARNRATAVETLRPPDLWTRPRG